MRVPRMTIPGLMMTATVIVAVELIPAMCAPKEESRVGSGGR
jgi:hypothetical protein